MSLPVESFITKLNKLSNTQESIELLSNWMIFYKNDAKVAVSEWCNFVMNAPNEKQLSAIYLANDVLQRSKNNNDFEYIREFGQIIRNILRHVYIHSEKGVRSRIDRVVNILSERDVLDSDVMQDIQQDLEKIKEMKFDTTEGLNFDHIYSLMKACSFLMNESLEGGLLNNTNYLSRHKELLNILRDSIEKEESIIKELEKVNGDVSVSNYCSYFLEC